MEKLSKENIHNKIKSVKASDVKTAVWDNVIWLFACSLYATGVVIFAIPNGIAQSGITGLSIIINHLIHTPVGMTNLVLNIPLTILAWKFIGWKFVAKTFWVTVVLSVALDVFGRVLHPYAYTGDKLLAALFCGAISGVSLALVLMRGATTGGVDTIARLFRHRWPHISMGRVILVADVIVIVTAAIVFRSVESALYAAIVIFVSTSVIDYILYGASSGKMLMVVTEHANEISKAITTEIKRGVTILPVQGGYTGQDKNMLICAVRGNEVSKLNKLIWQYDPNPFIIVSEAGEILGEGFKLPDKQ